ncbi:hypothetical protein [Streptomyces sp. JHA26]|uniref:hypothetical protein n=1 Tax=Streptomyces sp. JHA26 TaxID=1917143 RepID=UPI0035CF5F4E
MDRLERGGRDAVTTRAVADAAGLRPPALYRLFGDGKGCWTRWRSAVSPASWQSRSSLNPPRGPDRGTARRLGRRGRVRGDRTRAVPADVRRAHPVHRRHHLRAGRRGAGRGRCRPRPACRGARSERPQRSRRATSGGMAPSTARTAARSRRGQRAVPMSRTVRTPPLCRPCRLWPGRRAHGPRAGGVVHLVTVGAPRSGWPAKGPGRR